MLKFLTTYLDINEIEPITDYEAIGEIIEKQTYENVIGLHTKGFVFYYFDQLVKGAIEQDAFMTMGDQAYHEEGEAKKNINPYTYKKEWQPDVNNVLDIYNDVRNNSEKYKDSLIIVDQLSYDVFAEDHDIVEFTSALEKINAKILPLV